MYEKKKKFGGADLLPIMILAWAYHLDLLTAAFVYGVSLVVQAFFRRIFAE